MSYKRKKQKNSPFLSSRLQLWTDRPKNSRFWTPNRRGSWFLIAEEHSNDFGFAQGKMLGACPSSGSIFGTNLIPFEA
jgi:hypothetical protein